ncbi:MAG: alpha-amylase family glycosyl hydrolase [Candidatus Izemoplasmatales bacterium]|nr:alpha-amylase family glycosyl hydrolase [Candidatus Izemoplasmatales bacterium]
MLKTKISFRNKIIYQIYVRNHTPEGSFLALIPELNRIRSLGVDIVYLLPIHPIGVKNRKGSLGSPYSIQDYRLINPELGTKEDFLKLVDEVHARGMKIMIDEVFNHTSRDSRLLHEHPEYFYRNKAGDFANRVGDWWDVTDFDYTRDKGLWVELADTLKMYASMGVDGFRMDVASLVPLDFWKFARKEVAKVKKDVLWLSESVHGSFCSYIRNQGFECASESEIYQVFDMAYDYDVYPYYEDYLHGKRPLKDYLEAIRRQDEIYPANYIKMKNLENHDCLRIADYVQGNLDKIRNWTAFLYFQKGAVMLYGGQEFTATIRQTLFEKELFDRHEDISPLIQTLSKLKKKRIFAEGVYTVSIPEVDGVAIQSFENDQEKYVGIFNVGQGSGQVAIDLPDGNYPNLLGGKRLKVESGYFELSSGPIAIRIRK